MEKHSVTYEGGESCFIVRDGSYIGVDYMMVRIDDEEIYDRYHDGDFDPDDFYGCGFSSDVNTIIRYEHGDIILYAEMENPTWDDDQGCLEDGNFTEEDLKQAITEMAIFVGYDPALLIF